MAKTRELIEQEKKASDLMDDLQGLIHDFLNLVARVNMSSNPAIFLVNAFGCLERINDTLRKEIAWLSQKL